MQNELVHLLIGEEKVERRIWLYAECQDQKPNKTLPTFRVFLMTFNIKEGGCSFFLFYFLKWSGLTLPLTFRLSLKTKCLGVTV